MRLAIIVDKTLPPGLAANAAAILGMSIGRGAPESLGNDVSDAGGSLHPGITRLPVPVLEADAQNPPADPCLRLRQSRTPVRGLHGHGPADPDLRGIRGASGRCRPGRPAIPGDLSLRGRRGGATGDPRAATSGARGGLTRSKHIL